MKFRLEFPNFGAYVTQNLQNLVKISKGRDQNTFLLANQIVKKLQEVQTEMEEKGSRFQFLTQMYESFNQFIYNQTFKRNWLDYEDILAKQLPYWAKTGDFEKFFQAVIKFKICEFKRFEVEYTENKRKTIANYHV